MSELALSHNPRRAVDPLEVEEADFSRNLMDSMASANIPPLVSHDLDFSDWRRGYTHNPATCVHIHQRYKTRWICSDCGRDL